MFANITKVGLLWSKIKRQITIQLVFKIYRSLGIIPLSDKGQSSNRFRAPYLYVQVSLCSFILVTHFLNTIFRAVHDQSEFCQCMLEDVTMLFLTFVVVGMYRKLHKLEDLVRLLEASLSTADADVREQAQKAGEAQFFTFLRLACMTLWIIFLELLTPESERDLKRRSRIYGTKYPRRRLPIPVWIPGIDETEALYYVLNFALQLYFSVIFWLVCATVPLMPMIVANLQGQYHMLCKHIERLGSPQTDSEGNFIAYKDLAMNEYVVVLPKVESFPSPKADGFSDRFSSSRTWADYKRRRRNFLRKLKACEWQYFKEIIRVHQKLMGVKEQLEHTVAPMAPIIVILNYFAISLSLYQLTVSPTHLSKAKLFKFFAESSGLVVQFYYYCACGEIVDDFHSSMRTAFCASVWYSCSSSTQQGLRLLLLRLQKPYHPGFYGGRIVFWKPACVRLLQMCYQVVNLMQIKNARASAM